MTSYLIIPFLNHVFDRIVTLGVAIHFLVINLGRLNYFFMTTEWLSNFQCFLFLLTLFNASCIFLARCHGFMDYS